MECEEGSEDTIQEKEIPCSSEKMSLLDISGYTENDDISDDKQMTDKRKASGVINRYCKEE